MNPHPAVCRSATKLVRRHVIAAFWILRREPSKRLFCFVVILEKERKMELKSETSKALGGWINLPSWHTNHALDMERFYNFVDRYSREHSYPIDEDELREESIRRLNPRGKIGEELDGVLQSRIGLANKILEFLEHTGRQVM
jgi:hypothetical protein